MKKTTDFRSSSYWLMLLPKEDMFMVEAVGGWVDNIAVISAPTPIAGCLFEVPSGGMNRYDCQSSAFVIVTLWAIL